MTSNITWTTNCGISLLGPSRSTNLHFASKRSSNGVAGLACNLFALMATNFRARYYVACWMTHLVVVGLFIECFFTV